MTHIESVNNEMKKINGITDEIYEALADSAVEEAKAAIRKLHKVLEKLNLKLNVNKI
jgi:ElaB/YqjD/DUF883 family membrane-anchored ribosome-binding protein|tara:strand:+ start:291 stop:461 length:171 start_codon:yes stop_codon:yes gene_type:complete